LERLFELILFIYGRGGFAAAPINKQNSECGKLEKAPNKKHKSTKKEQPHESCSLYL